MVKDKLACIQDNIAQICQRLGRNPAEITLVGVTKFATIEKIQTALSCGLSHIGENKVQEAQKKFSVLAQSSAQVTKHMIGHLQTNKVKAALQIFDMIQSVDSLKVAQEVERQAEKLNKTADILLQVNCSGEEQKFGLAKAEVLPLLEQMAGFKHLSIQGLMTVAPLTEEDQLIRSPFRDLRELKEKVTEQFSGHPRVTMRYLSMGMTNDYPIALEEGANMLRIGSAIFKDNE